MLSSELQLSIPLTADNPYSPAFFVPHSGVVQALDTIRAALLKPDTFSFFRLDGPSGCGKSHLIHVLAAEADCSGAVSYAAFDDTTDWSDDETVRRFIDQYERLKTDGGVIVCAGATPENPHVSSRFSLAAPLAIYFPADEELRPLVAAILDRRGLRFPDTELEYLAARLPASPLSLSDIFAKIDRLSLALGKRPNRALFREVLASEFGEGGHGERENE